MIYCCSHIFKFVEHLFYGGAVFSAVLLVGRLEGRRILYLVLMGVYSNVGRLEGRI